MCESLLLSSITIHFTNNNYISSLFLPCILQLFTSNLAERDTATRHLRTAFVSCNFTALMLKRAGRHSPSRVVFLSPPQVYANASTRSCFSEDQESAQNIFSTSGMLHIYIHKSTQLQRDSRGTSKMCSRQLP